MNGVSKRSVGVALALVVAGSLAAAPEDLTLGEALTRALERSPRLRVSRLVPRVAREALGRERAGWDPSLGLELSRDDGALPASSGLDGAPVRKSDTRNAAVTLGQPLAGGGRVDVGISDRRSANNSTFTLVNPTYRSGVSVGYRQPLLRGRGRDATRVALGLAEVDLDRARWSLRQDVLDVMAATERAYWNLGASRERTEVARLSLEQALTLLEGNRYRVKTGSLSQIAVLDAEAAVTERRDSLFSADRELVTLELSLLERIDPPVRPGQEMPALPDLPGRELPEVPGFEELLGQALAKDPGYRQVQLDARAQGIRLAFARDAVLARLDLTASLEMNGISGMNSDSREQAIRGDFPSRFVGLVYEIPFGNRAARAERRRVQLEVERALARIREEEVRISTRVEDARRRYRLERERIQVAGARVEAAARKVEAQEGRYREGLIPADDLLRFQRELAEARLSEVNARVQASLASLDMWVAAGVLPERRGVSLDDLGVQGEDEG